MTEVQDLLAFVIHLMSIKQIKDNVLTNYFSSIYILHFVSCMRHNQTFATKGVGGAHENEKGLIRAQPGRLP